MLIFFGIWATGTAIALLFLDGPWQFVVFIGSAWLGVWITASREDDGTRWSDENAKRSGDR